MLQNLKFKLHGLLNPEEGPNSPKNAANIVETLQSSSDQSLELKQQNDQENVSPTLAKAVQAAHSAVECLLKEQQEKEGNCSIFQFFNNFLFSSFQQAQKCRRTGDRGARVGSAVSTLVPAKSVCETRFSGCWPSCGMGNEVKKT